MRTLPIRRAVGPIALMLLALVSFSATADAQLGGMLRRAAGKRVEQKAEDRMGAASLIDPTFDNTTVEITSERIDKFLVALEKRQAQRAQMRAAYEALDNRSSATRDSARMFDNQRDRNAYEAADRRYDECRSNIREGIEAEQQRKGQELAAKAQANPMAAQNDPTMKRFMAAMQEVAAAQQRNDQVALKAAMDKMATIMGGATDSVSLDRAAVTKCGGRPAIPASMLRYKQLNDRADSLGKAARDLNASSNSVNGADVGLTDIQARMMSERIRSWLAGMRDDAPITKTFGKGEYELLVARRGDLRKAFSGSE
jgi:hypothetical protein